MKNVLLLSYGKDSMATIEVATRLGIQIDEIRHIEIMFDKDTPADLPSIMEFKAYANKKIKERYGIEVTTVKSPNNFKELALMDWTKQPGVIHGYPSTDRQARWCRNEMKIKPFDNKDEVKIIGIAIDEAHRCEKNNPKVRYPLVEAGWTEAECLEWCRENDLLSPTYTEEDRARSGCFFCHLQTNESMRATYNYYPEIWEKWLKLDKQMQRKAKDGTFSLKTAKGGLKIWLTDYDERFKLEDTGIVPKGAKFKWTWMDKDKRDQTRILVLDYSVEGLGTLEACKELGWPIDEVRVLTLKFDEDTEADHPDILEYKNKVNEFIKERYGVEITKIYFPNTYKELFTMDFTKQPGRMHGYPHLNGRWCREVMKNKWQVFHYIDISETYYKPLVEERADEADKERANNRYPLIEAGWTREKCEQWVAEMGLTAPREDDFCWYCPFMKIDRLKELRTNHPDLWAKWLEIDRLALSKWTGDPMTSPVRMKGRWWLDAFDKRFELEAQGKVPEGRKFRWSMLEDVE